MGILSLVWTCELARKTKNSQAAAGEKNKPRIGFAGGEIGFQFFQPGRPERDAAQNAESYVEK